MPRFRSHPTPHPPRKGTLTRAGTSGCYTGLPRRTGPGALTPGVGGQKASDHSRSCCSLGPGCAPAYRQEPQCPLLSPRLPQSDLSPRICGGSCPITAAQRAPILLRLLYPPPLSQSEKKQIPVLCFTNYKDNLTITHDLYAVLQCILV